MVFNTKVTIYHKGFDKKTKLETWTRYNYDKAWVYINRAAKTDKGYDDANGIQVRLSYDLNSDLSANNFSIGDIIVPQELNININRQQELSGYNIYNITKINDNFYGINKHIHLGGK